MLFNYWSEENRVVSSALKIVRTETYVGRYNWNDIYEYHRIAYKTYSYVGMNEATAKLCQEEMLRKYTRTFTCIYNERGTYKPSTYTQFANVECQKDEGDMWSVTISINEDQKQYGYIGGFPVAFIEDLDYEEDAPKGNMLRIANIYKQTMTTHVYLDYQQSIPNFSRTDPRFVVQTCATKNGTWTAITPIAITSTDGHLDFLAINVSNYVRIKWDNIISNVVEFPEAQYSRAIEITNLSFANQWVLDYSASFVDFNFRNVSVYERVYGNSAWTDITSNCVLQSNYILTNLDTRQDYEFYLEYDGVSSPTVRVPYDPSIDVGDGSIVVQSCYWQHYGGLDQYTAKIITSAAQSDIVMKGSADGRTWFTITPTISPLGPSYPTLYYALFNGVPEGTTKYYVKFFVGSTQASNAFELTIDDSGPLTNNGCLSEVENLTTFYIQHIQNFDYESEDFKAQMSLDNGVTWTDMTPYALLPASQYTIQSQSIGTMDITPRLFRLSYTSGSNNWLSNVVKYPLA